MANCFFLLPFISSFKDEPLIGIIPEQGASPTVLTLIKHPPSTAEEEMNHPKNVYA